MAVLSVRVICVALLSILTWLLLTNSLGEATQSDLDCLRSIANTLEDPERSLASWNFSNTTEGAICRFTGIQCWHDDENRVLNVRLGHMGLRGEFPQGLVGCFSMTGLDLSGNILRGNIPSNISHIIGTVTTLDLSSNQFSGEIPENIVNLTFLNSLRLNDNQLSGQIPLQIGQLGRLSSFSVARNRLSGPVPSFNSTLEIGRDSFAGNAGLCGHPMPACGTASSSTTPLIIGAAIGGVSIGAVGTIALGIFFYMRRGSRKELEEEGLVGNTAWAKSIKGAKHMKISMFDKSVSKMTLADLMKATNDFSEDNIIGSGRTGTMYKAVLDRNMRTSLIVKRLQDTQHSEKQFLSEMATLENVNHQNLVPLLGFCMTRTERFLLYKFMPNGTLYDKLHKINNASEAMAWPLRLKIGLKAAKGLAWLHHICNPSIIHRNISSKYILLDEDYEPKISDVGLVRLMNPMDSRSSTLVNSKFGDLGYLAPEFVRTLVPTTKGDVYSFGVVLLELVTGEKATYVAKAPDAFRGDLVGWLAQLYSISRLHRAIDRSLVLKEGYDEEEIIQFVRVACSCVLPGHKERPTMLEVYRSLREIGQRYDFVTEDDDEPFRNQLVELVVA